MNNKIKDFISRRFKEDYNWTTGRCYFFAIILKDVFPGGKIFYDPIDGHFLYKYENNFYDWTGQKTYTEKEIDCFYEWDRLKDWEPFLEKRIRHDCIE